jgi:septal ring factor EnvC (AmiA/AmiB activator)
MDSEENKMKISDTPRTDDAEYLSYDSEPPQSLEMVDVGFARQLEIELNAAIVNEAFAENKAYMLEKELKQAQDRIKERDEWNEGLDGIIDRLTEKIIFLSEIRQEAGVENANLREKLSAANERIKRLEEAGNNLLWNFCPEYTSDLTQEQSDALKQWNKAKEAKL